MGRLRKDLMNFSLLKCFVENDEPTLYDFIATYLECCEKRDELTIPDTHRLRVVGY